MKILNSLQYTIRYKLGFVPFLAKYIFWDGDAILKKLEEAGIIQQIRDLPPAERRMLHFSFGRQVRNAFLLWHPKNPHTMLKLAGLSSERSADSPYHPDNYSWAVISRLIVAADVPDSQTSADFDASESLLYSLMACGEDSEDIIDGIQNAVLELVDHERWDLLDQVFEETILYNPSPAKLQALLNGLGEENLSRISPVNYLRVAQRAIGYGIVVNRGTDN